MSDKKDLIEIYIGQRRSGKTKHTLLSSVLQKFFLGGVFGSAQVSWTIHGPFHHRKSCLTATLPWVTWVARYAFCLNLSVPWSLVNPQTQWNWGQMYGCQSLPLLVASAPLSLGKVWSPTLKNKINVSSKNVSLCRQGTWETTDIVMSSLFPRNKLAQILVPFGFGLPILVSLGVYNTASFRGVARLPEDNYSLFPVVYRHPLRDPSSNYQNLDQ